jgi:NAD+ kinase
MSAVSPARSIHFVASSAPEAVQARARLAKRYGNVPAAQADVIVALGGDGLMLSTLHAFLNTGKPIYGMNRGSVGFLTNEYAEEGLVSRLAEAKETIVRPLMMHVVDLFGRAYHGRAFNEVSLLRQTYQAAKLRILVDGQERLAELVCDGVLISTPAGSTAYNLSAQGPIIPIDAPLLALTPISPFRPRRWRGALLPDRARVRIEALEADKRPVSAVADHFEVRDIAAVDVEQDRTTEVPLLFDPGHSLDERILREQFGY